MILPTAKKCSNCSRLQHEIDQLKEEVRDLKGANQALQVSLAEAKKDSSTSSKPPSSDLVKPPKTSAGADQPKGKIGAQPGHPANLRSPFPPEQINRTMDHHLDCCPECGHGLQDSQQPPRVVQQIDLPQSTPIIEEHRSYAGWCPQCQKLFAAPLPKHIEEGGLFGCHLRTVVAYLKGACHASYSTIRKYFRDVLQIPVSRGYLAKVIAEVTAMLARPYEELFERLPEEGFVNVDETGHPDQGADLWTWCVRAELFTLYHVDPCRKSDVLMELLGKEYEGVLGCDYFSAYRRYMRLGDIRVQFCLAHLIRDVKFLTTLPDGRDRAYGERLREALRGLFQVIHAHERLGERSFQKALRHARDKVLEAGMDQVPAGKHCQNMAKRFRKHGESYFTFMTTPGVDPTNNVVEQALRFVVIDRLITQGTRSAIGQRWCERIWTVMATCAQQGKSVYAFVGACITASLQGTATPSLLS